MNEMINVDEQVVKDALQPVVEETKKGISTATKCVLTFLGGPAVGYGVKAFIDKRNTNKAEKCDEKANFWAEKAAKIRGKVDQVEEVMIDPDEVVEE